jgi:hypothetical protein
MSACDCQRWIVDELAVSSVLLCDRGCMNMCEDKPND